MTASRLALLALMTSTACGPSAEDDYETLNECGAVECDAATAQRIEGGMKAALNGMDCVLAALRDRRPGRFVVRLDHSFTNGSEGVFYTYVLDGSDQAFMAARERTSIDGEGDEVFRPTMRCGLRPPSFFADCLAAYEQGSDVDFPDEAWDCIFPRLGADPPWLEACVEEPPRCG